MSQSPGIPINIEAEYHSLAGLMSGLENERLSAREELGGLAPSDERWPYMPFAESVLEDPRKQQIARGLGELGLMAMTSSDMHNRMNSRARILYAASLLDYRTHLDGHQRVLRTPGNEEADWFRRMYGDATEAWSIGYGNELHHLSEQIGRSGLYAGAQAIKKAHPKEVHHAQQGHRRPADRLVVRRQPSGDFTVTSFKQVKRAAA